MRRKLLSLVALSAMCLALFGIAAPVAAHDPHPVNPCDFINPVGNRATGHSSSSPTHDRLGIRGYIDPANTGFEPCGTGGNNHSSLWIAVTERGGNNGARIFQVGVVQCNWSGQTVCSGSTPHYFYAAAGCGTSLPNAIDLGVAGFGGHTMQMGKSSQNNNWYVWIDKNADGDLIDSGEQVLTLDDADPRTQCWINTVQHEFKFIGERGDGGDGLGQFGDASWITNLKHQESAGGAFVSDYWNTQAPYQICTWSDDGVGQGYSYCAGGGRWNCPNVTPPEFSDEITVFTDQDGPNGSYPCYN